MESHSRYDILEAHSISSFGVSGTILAHPDDVQREFLGGLEAVDELPDRTAEGLEHVITSRKTFF